MQLQLYITRNERSLRVHMGGGWIHMGAGSTDNGFMKESAKRPSELAELAMERARRKENNRALSAIFRYYPEQ